MKKKLYIFSALIVGLAAIFLFVKNYFFAVLIAALAVSLLTGWNRLWQFRQNEIQKLTRDMEALSRQNAALSEEIDELRRRKWNVADIRHILDLGIMQINTAFTRTWDKKFKHGKKEVYFIGALKVHVSARYGIDLKDLRFRYVPEQKKLFIANLQPKLLAFNDINYIWEIAEILEYKKPFFGSNYWRKSKELQELGAQIKEELRLRTHEEVKNGPEEMQWVLDPVKTHLIHTVKWLFHIPGIEVEIADSAGEDYLPLEEFFTNFPSASALPQATNDSSAEKA